MALYTMPGGPLPVDDEDALAAWIKRARSVAFLNGARHDEIDRLEARAIIAALAQGGPDA